MPVEPQIKYATTSDGVDIAFFAMGEGTPVVMLPPATPWSHIEMEWQIPEWRHFYEHVIDHHQLIRFDGRGSGLSDRNATPNGLESMFLDLDAVVGRLGIDRFALYGVFGAGPMAMGYAARYPERVSRLLLWCAYPSGASLEDTRSEALKRLMELDWEMFTETLAHSVFGWEQGAQAHRLAEYMRHAMDADKVRACWDITEEMDVTAMLPQIQAPTLVMHRRGFKQLPIEVARQLASRIPDARLSLFDGVSLSPYMGDMRAHLDIMDAFLGIDPDRIKNRMTHNHPEDATPPPGFRTILFTDLEGSTALTQRVGDAQAQDVVRAHNDIVREALRRHGGTEVKHTGDGIMASFLSSSQAVECAITIQRVTAAHNLTHPGVPVAVRIGINAGEPFVEGDDLFGTAVQLASRVCTQAEADQILVADVVRQLVAGKGFLFSDVGDVLPKGFEDPVRIFEVRWRETV